MESPARVNRGPVQGAVVLTSLVRARWPSVYGEERRSGSALSRRRANRRVNADVGVGFAGST